jgi:hypothetical protein
MDNFQEASGQDFDISLKFRYLFPIGHGRGNPVARIVLEKGILVQGQTGAEGWHPFSSGRTFLEINPFYRTQQLSSEATADINIKTSGLTFGLLHDNTDFSENPSRGSYKKVAFSKDWGELGSSHPWESMELEYAKFINLGSGAKTRQRVLAFNFWASYALTWNDFEVDADGNRVFLRPPNHKGSRLGGIERLKDLQIVASATAQPFTTIWNIVISQRGIHWANANFSAGQSIFRGCSSSALQN